MAELFEAIGFEVADEQSYNSLVEYVETNGHRTRTQRGDAALHGRCWKLGDGLEVWSILYERGADLYYADCRPAFRSRYVRTVLPWELVEYDEDGEAIVRGGVPGAAEIVFELQNLTELDDAVFRESHLHVALAGIAYAVRVQPTPDSKRLTDLPAYRFELAERLEGFADKACENDYVISGRVLSWRDIRNPVTAADLVWIYIDAAVIRIEVLANRRALRGELKIGAEITANIWLQGHVLEERDISARYEGVDREYEQADFWAGLRRGN
ncbi:MAG TPA: DUF3881 family protein [Blastocatellia bacterium]|nr:DUF3881 family protein [Blastocatellia bacterium]